MGTRTLVGRTRECALLEGFAASSTSVAVVHGDAGMGKTALIQWAVERSPKDARVLQVTGTPSARDRPFAGLRRLLDPLLDEMLPATRSRWRVISELESPDAAGAALSKAGMTVLSLLSDVSVLRRLILVADDLQWLDRPSREVLAFVGRRLGVDPISMILGVRDPVPADVEQAALTQDWLVLQIPPLTDSDSMELLDRCAPGLEPADRQRVLVEAAGNPLALEELPNTVNATPLQPVAQIPVSHRLEAAFASRLSSLPDTTQALVLVAAMHDSDSIEQILATCEVLPGAPASQEHVKAAEGAGLLSVVNDAVLFRHPLVRSAVYQSAGPPVRRAAHRALEQTAAAADLRAWHAAAGAEGPDESIAAQLDEVAAEALRVGANDTAADALQEAARVSADPRQRSIRLLRAVEMRFDLGQYEQTLQLLEEIDAGALDPEERARLDWLRELITSGPWSGGSRVPSFMAITERTFASGNIERAAEMLIGIALRMWWSNVDGATEKSVSEVAERMRAATGDAWYCTLIALADPVERGKEVLALLDHITAAEVYPDSNLLLLVGMAGTGVGDHPRANAMFASAIAESRTQGRFGVLSQALVAQAWTELHLGRLGRAIEAGEEGARLAEETQQPLWCATGELACAAAHGLRGEPARAESLIAKAEQVFMGSGANPLLAQVQVARGLTALGAERYEDAYDQLARIFQPTDASYHQYMRLFVVAELAEAASHCGRVDTARSLL
jgi:tetratricopeptide (TPR) repeat protein